MSRIFVFASVILFGLSSCSSTSSKYFYTDSLQDNYRWSSDDLKKIQFYLSENIVLWKDVRSDKSTITDGKIKTIDGRLVEEIVIKAGTPGVYLFSPQKDHFAITFDPNDDSKYLVFGPSNKMRGRYVLLAKSWDRNLGKVTYGDQLYNTNSNSAFVHLMVEIKKTGKTKVVSSTPSGRKV
ncbi:MAG: hypothetical protein R2774_13035 [Saprospiraceae bacterium]